MRGGRALAAPSVLAGAALADAARACEVCFGANTDSALIDGAKIGVFLLLAVTVCVQGGFAAFFVYLWKRAKRLQNQEIDAEWAHLQRGSTHP